MKFSIAVAAAALIAGQAAAQEAYRTCSADKTELGLQTVEAVCGMPKRPALPVGGFRSASQVEAAAAERDAFSNTVDAYGVCVTRFINSYRRPGADASSTAPDQAACAHAWAEDQVTQAVIDYGRACIDFSNRSVVDAAIQPWTGSCYPSRAGD